MAQYHIASTLSNSVDEPTGGRGALPLRKCVIMKILRMDEKAPLPRLNDYEWSAVVDALDDARTCQRNVGRDRQRGLLSGLGSLIFRRCRNFEVHDASIDVVRRFICASGLRSPHAAELKPELEKIGFTRGQIEAMEILSR